jgi:hypothetical protein
MFLTRDRSGREGSVMRIRSLAVLAVLPIVLGLSACGGDKSGNGVATAGGGDPAASASPGQSIDARDAQLRYAQCMRENGIDVPDPEPGKPVRITGNGDKTNYDKLQAAQKKCQPILEQGGVAPDPNDPARQDANLKFAQCMREHGVNVPDPKPGEGLKIQAQDGDKAKIEAAQKECRQHLPGGGPGGGQ